MTDDPRIEAGAFAWYMQTDSHCDIQGAHGAWMTADDGERGIYIGEATCIIEAADEADRAAGVVRVDIRDWRWVEYISEAIYDEIDGNSSFKEIAEACLKAIADPHAEAVLAALTEAKP